MENICICSNLYGDGSRNARLRAEYIYCERHQECSAYKAGKCGAVTSFLSPQCRVGKVQREDGGTKQSKKFHTLTYQVKERPDYAKLDYPYNDYIIRIGNDAWLKPPFVDIKYTDGKLSVGNPGFGCNHVFLPAEALTVDNMHEICSTVPYNWSWDPIKKYQTEVVPTFLFQLSKLFPELYADLVEQYPKYKELSPNFVGRHAKIETLDLSDGIMEPTKKVKFLVDGGYLICKDWPSAFNPFNAKTVEVKVPMNGLTVKVTDNKQVTDYTEFVD